MEQAISASFENLRAIALRASKCRAKKVAEVDSFCLSDAHLTHLTAIISNNIYRSISRHSRLKMG